MRHIKEKIAGEGKPYEVVASEIAHRSFEFAHAPFDTLGDVEVVVFKRKTSLVCKSCGKELKAPKRCKRCKAVRYCGQTCQTDHWQLHKASCKPAPASSLERN